MTVPALQSTVLDLVEEYERKEAAIEDEIRAFEAAVRRLEMAGCVQGTYVGSILSGRLDVNPNHMRRNLLKSGWKAIYDRLQIDTIAPANDQRKFEMAIEDPAPLTFENAKATFGDYIKRPRFHILRGLAEVFVGLDPAYKSHSKVKIGVEGLPKRVIVSNVGSYGYGLDKIQDIMRALAAYRGQRPVERVELRSIADLGGFVGHKAGEVVFDGSHVQVADGEMPFPNRGITVKKFKNGNAHVIFDRDALLDINRALAEFYGDVLPDVEEEAEKPRESTAVARDLQYYPTPHAVVCTILDAVGLYKPQYGGPVQSYRVLEPSCGDGRILDELAARGYRGFGIEVHPGRAAEARAKGHSVVVHNFLEYPPSPEFDFVVMNPPFYGRHYVKHVRRALKFLKPGGYLVSVLPATAWYDHKELAGSWHDLPVASFAESGTNIPTGYIIMRAV